MESIRGQMDKFIKASGLMELKVVLEFGEARAEIHTLDSGKMD